MILKVYASNVMKICQSPNLPKPRTSKSHFSTHILLSFNQSVHFFLLFVVYPNPVGLVRSSVTRMVPEIQCCNDVCYDYFKCWQQTAISMQNLINLLILDCHCYCFDIQETEASPTGIFLFIENNLQQCLRFTIPIQND